MKKAVLGFSGGVDSAVSAVLLKKEGYEVAGVYLDNCGSDALEAAVSGAEFSDIPLEIIDVRQELEEKVCSRFADEYLCGRTPNPCIICNPAVKFRKLLEYADSIGADYIATGHYARTEVLPEGGRGLYKGNPENDQSYMLCRITKSQLDRLLLPLGNYPKREVRKMAAELGLPAAGKPDSMEICFIPDKDYIGWLSRRTALPGPGPVVLHGEQVGEHGGIFRWTVGQRWPGLINGRKVYVSRICPAENAIELSLWEELFTCEVNAAGFNFLAVPGDAVLGGNSAAPISVPEDSSEVPNRAADRLPALTAPEGLIMENLSVRVRHTKWENPPCRACFRPDGSVRITCEEPVRAPAAGQSAVLYSGDRVIGGGFIMQP